MTLYSLLTFIHIVAAIGWIGGAFTIKWYLSGDRGKQIVYTTTNARRDYA